MKPTDADAIEQLVEQFVALREREPELTPAAFARAHPDAGPDLLPALQGAVDVLAALAPDGDGVPERIGPYRVLRELGRGGMGVVYEVDRDGARFALKRLSAAGLLQARAVPRLLREARALQRIRHPGIVGVHDAGIADGLPFVAMELVDGRPLAGLGPLPWRQAVMLVQQVAAAVASVHAAGLCHRDLKPHNVLLRADGTPVVVDFGLAHDETDGTLTATGDLLGTPRYFAPEQARGQPADARSDVFALGLILAELLTGRPVRAAVDRSRLLAEAQQGAAPDLRPVAGLPRCLRRILRVALATEPRRRFASAAALAEDLDRAGRGLPVRARPPGPLLRAADWGRRHPRRAGAVVLILFAVAAAAGAFARAQFAAAARGRARAQVEQGVLAWLGGDAATVQGAARAALAEDPANTAAAALLALAGDGAMPPDAGIGHFAAGLQHRRTEAWSEAALAFAAAARRDPGCALVHVLRAEAEQRLGNVAGAVADLETAARLLPDSPALAAALGQARLHAGDAPGAIAEYRRALAMQPRSFRLHYQLARACYGVDGAAGLTALAEASTLLASPRGPEWTALRNLEASLLDKLGRTDEAIAILRELAAAHPDDVQIAFNLAYALDRSLAVAEARPFYEQVLQLEPHHLRAALCLCWLCATAEPPLRDLDRAESLLRAALQRDQGRSPEVLSMVREFGLHTGRIAGLLDDLAALAARPDLPADRRATLLHTRSFLANAAPGRGR